MKESILVLTHADETGTALTKPSREALTAGLELAAQLSASLTIGIIAANSASAANALASIGARLLSVSSEPFAQSRYATDAAACEALCRAAQATIVLAPASARFSRVAAGVAHRLGGFIDTHITSIGGKETIEATRWFYRQRVEAVLTRDVRPWFLLLDAGTHAAYCGDSSPADVEEEIRGQIDLNITALTALTRLFLPPMVQRRSGRIMNVASTAGFQPGPLMAVYYAPWAYVLSFSEAIANELRHSGVTVTCFCPGATN